MRNKIKQIMNKEEGFTLVELLAVIVVLGIIVAIAIPSIGRVIDRAQENSNDAEQSLIIDAARLYFTAEEDTGNTVTVTQLETAGYLEQRGSDAVQRGTVTRTQESNESYSYAFSDEEG